VWGFFFACLFDFCICFCFSFCLYISDQCLLGSISSSYFKLLLLIDISYKTMLWTNQTQRKAKRL
jgi:hypothetical protein